jgi:hypothetical protein
VTSSIHLEGWFRHIEHVESSVFLLNCLYKACVLGSGDFNSVLGSGDFNSVSTIFLLEFRTIPTVWYICICFFRLFSVM